MSEKPKWKTKMVAKAGDFIIDVDLPRVLEENEEEGYEFVCIVPCAQAVFLYRRIDP